MAAAAKQKHPVRQLVHRGTRQHLLSPPPASLTFIHSPHLVGGMIRCSVPCADDAIGDWHALEDRYRVMEVEPEDRRQTEPRRSAPPRTATTLSTPRISRLLHPRVYTGVLTGITVAITQPNDIADLSARQFGKDASDRSFHLTLLEAFLLSSLSALTLVPPLPLSALLTHGCRHIVGFPALLLTYIRCTARGWTVREGSKLGVDFLLYRQSSGESSSLQRKSRQHSVYAVRVIEQQQSEKDEADTSAGSSGTAQSAIVQVNAVLRVAQSTKKRLLVSTVTVPADTVWEGEGGLTVLSRCHVHLCELSRWSPTVHVE